jgi:hypothetical protein
MTEGERKQMAARKAERLEPAKKDGRGGARPNSGPKKGTPLRPEHIERIRASINAKLCIDTLNTLVATGSKDDSVRVQAATVLLRKVLPDLTATDLTSGGESLVVERVAFKPPTKRVSKK